MQIQILGSGCANCKRLYEMTSQIVAEQHLDAKVEYITDVSKIIEMGIMTSPVLAVDGNPVITGFIPDKEKVKTRLLAAIKK